MSTLQTTILKHPDSASNQIAFTSGGDINLDSGAVFIDSANNYVGIGTSAPTSPLHIIGSSSGGFLGGGIRLNDTAHSSDWFIGGAADADSSDGSLQIAESNGATRMIFDTEGRVGIGSDPVSTLDVARTTAINSEVRIRNSVDGLRLVMQSDGVTNIRSVFNRGIAFGSGTSNSDATYVERMRILPTGGITFNGDTAVNNSLNDYEEGNWTPSIYTGGWSGITIETAKYIKVGAKVLVTMYASGLVGSGSGAAFALQGLPFNPATLCYAPGPLDVGKGSVKGTYCRTENNTNRIGFYYPSESSASRIAPQGNSFYIDGYIILALSYFTDQ